MKKRVMKVMALLGTGVLLVGNLAGCGQTETAAEAPALAEDVTETPSAAEVAPAEEAGEDLSGTITMAGSTSMEKLANATAEAFMAKYPEVTVTAEFTGSSAGVEALLGGSVDIGNSSRNLKDTETEAGAVENIVAIDGIAVVVNPANTVEGLTKEQLTDIYTGKIKNWSEAGGADQAVIVVGREAGSGTRGAFTKPDWMRSWRPACGARLCLTR